MELARLFRTMRWVGLGGAYVLFGIISPLVTRYQEALLRNVGNGIKIQAPPPTPDLAITSFVGNASQIGLLVTIFIAAGSLAFDARPEWAAFLRTRSPLPPILMPKFWVNAGAAAAAFALATVVAWIETAVLIGGLPTAGMLAGIGYWIVYLAFVVAAVALSAGFSRSVIGVAGFTAVVLIAMPLGADVLTAVKPWMPSTLVGALPALAAGASPSGFVRAAASAVVLGAAALLVSTRLLASREL
jgi:hypothetical protein